MVELKRSPLAPAGFPDLGVVAGVRLASTNSGSRYTNRDDLMLVELAPGTCVAGVFTRSFTASAPVRLCRKHLAINRPRALIVNAGNANTFTGRSGERDAEMMCRAVADEIGVAVDEVFIASTGVIGEPLPMDRILAAISTLAKDLDPGAARWKAAAAAIMTTDTFAKGASARATIDGTPVVVNGYAKGSGMIEPDMATMLVFLYTDAALSAEVLQALLERINRRTFNAITVDSDTSTSDSCLLFATGQAGNSRPENEDDPRLSGFAVALEAVMRDLAIQVIRDGEGARKLIEITVRGATDETAAHTVAKSIANSPLVKTAIAGEDANWGRVVMAVGKAGVRVDPDRLSIAMGGIPITTNGQRRDDYDETPVAQHLAGDEITIDVDLGEGSRRATVWTCDLTHGYIEINADYRS